MVKTEDLNICVWIVNILSNKAVKGFGVLTTLTLSNRTAKVTEITQGSEELNG